MDVYTVYLIIFASSNLKFIIREFSFFFSSAIIKIIFARLLNSRIRPPR